MKMLILVVAATMAVLVILAQDKATSHNHARDAAGVRRYPDRVNESHAQGRSGARGTGQI